MYPILCKMLNIRNAMSRAPRIVKIAVIGLLLAFIEQVLGYATNFWLIKQYGGSSYNLYGLWKRCLCSSKCYCDVSGRSNYIFHGKMSRFGFTGGV